MTRSKWMRIKYIDVGVIYCLALQRLWICSALSSKNKTYISLLYVSYIYIFFYLRLNILTSVVQCIFHVITYLYRFRIYYPLPKKKLYYQFIMGKYFALCGIFIQHGYILYWFPLRRRGVCQVLYARYLEISLIGRYQLDNTGFPWLVHR